MILEQFFSEFYLGYRMEIDMGGQIYYAVFDLYDPNEFKTPCYTKSDIAHMVTGSQRFNDYLLRPLSEEWRYAGAERPEMFLSGYGKMK